MTKTKVLKIKVGTAYINNQNVDVFQDAWEKISKEGNTYYETRNVIFVREVETKDNPTA